MEPDLHQDASNKIISLHFHRASIVKTHILSSEYSECRCIIKSWLQSYEKDISNQRDCPNSNDKDDVVYTQVSSTLNIENEQSFVWSSSDGHVCWDTTKGNVSNRLIQVEVFIVMSESLVDIADYIDSGLEQHEIEAIIQRSCEKIGKGITCIDDICASNKKDRCHRIDIADNSVSPNMKLDVSLHYVDHMESKKDLESICNSSDVGEGLKNETMKHSICASTIHNKSCSPSKRASGAEKEFALTIKIMGIAYLNSLRTVRVPQLMWLSYRYNGEIVQTDTFQYTKESDFKESSEVFYISKLDDNNKMLTIYLCTDGTLIGYGQIDLYKTFQVKGLNQAVHGFIKLMEHDRKSKPQPILFSLVPDTPQLDLSLKLTKNAKDELCSNPRIKNTDQIEEEENLQHPSMIGHDSVHGQISERCICGRMSNLKWEALEEELEIKRREWEKWRYDQELLWRDELKTREKRVRLELEKQIQERDKERTGIMESSRVEYKRLEQRLRKALFQVEERERQLKSKEMSQQNEWDKKCMDLELQKKKNLVESKHSVRIAEQKANDATQHLEDIKRELKEANLYKEAAQTKLGEYKELESELRIEISHMQDEFQKMEARSRQKTMELEELQCTAQKLSQLLHCEKEKNVSLSNRNETLAKEMTVGRRSLPERNLNELHRIQNELSSINCASPSCRDVPSSISG